MARKQRGVGYDKDPDANTRPDTVPAALRFNDDSATWSNLSQRGERELAPYTSRPEILPPSDEPTVADRSLWRMPVPERRAADERPKRETPMPSSGLRHRLASTAPPPVRKQPEPAPDTHETEVDAAPAPAHIPTLRRSPQGRSSATSLSTPPRAHRKNSRMFVITVALMTIPASVLGMSVGNGSLERAFTSLLGARAEPQLTPAVPAARTTAPASETAVSTPPQKAARPARAAEPEAAPIPTLRFRDLPLAAAEDLADESSAASNRRRSKNARSKRR
jgi:hypothetical protein